MPWLYLLAIVTCVAGFSPLHLRLKHCSYTKKLLKGKTMVSSLFKLSSGWGGCTSASAAIVQCSNCYSCLYQGTDRTPCVMDYRLLTQCLWVKGPHCEDQFPLYTFE